MSSDTILTAEDGTQYSWDNLASQKWLDGHVPGAEQAVGWLLGEAIEMFRRGEVDDAVELRKLAERMRKAVIPPLKSAAEKHSTDHPYELGP